jgi:2-alkyl-3-oxoalkanoate reductase
MSTLVTGASGFIGRRVVARLLRDGEPVRALLFPHEELPGVERALGDVTDRASVVAALDGVDRVVHLAAKVGDWGPLGEFRAVNVGGTTNVIAAAGDRRVVHVSSIVVYGPRLRTGGCEEDAPLAYGLGPYGITKRESEVVASRGPNVAVVRPGNVWGPVSPLWVEELSRLLRAGRVPLVDGGVGDAHLAHVENVVDVIVAALTAPAAGGRVYNAVDGHGVSWRRYLTDLARVAGAPPPWLTLPRSLALAAAVGMEAAWRLARAEQRPLMTREAVQLLASGPPVSNTRAVRELGFRPRSYEEGLQSLIRPP